MRKFRGTPGILAQTTLAGCSGLEKMMPKKVCDLAGYREAVEGNPEFHKLAEMIELDSGFAASMTPIQRMALCLGGAVMTVAAQNAAKAVLLQSKQEQLVSGLIAQRDAAAAQGKATTTSQTTPNIVRTDPSKPPAQAPAQAVKPLTSFSMYD